ncbi:MAG TPA: hypothetical protein VNA28_01840 [Solirubrobacteraceae bacterium]|nr:hypothetical protein [Solirubrobacteraceae bacterium]
MSRLRRTIAVLAVALASGGLAACGNHPDEEARVQHIENEGFYLKLGELKYQVQLSRQLNPDDVQDRALLGGIPAEDQKLGADEVWFGVFIQVENESGEPLEPSSEIEIIDTQERIFRPLELEESNRYAYRPEEPIAAGQILPIPDTPAYDTPIQGSMMLFKLPGTALDNRPLELKIEGDLLPPQTGIIDLDV